MHFANSFIGALWPAFLYFPLLYQSRQHSSSSRSKRADEWVERGKDGSPLASMDACLPSPLPDTIPYKGVSLSRDWGWFFNVLIIPTNETYKVEHLELEWWKRSPAGAWGSIDVALDKLWMINVGRKSLWSQDGAITPFYVLLYTFPLGAVRLHRPRLPLLI